MLRAVAGRLSGSDAAFAGYEIHLGQTTGDGVMRPFAVLDGHGPDGAWSADGRIGGAYVHGLFDRAQARAALLAPLGVAAQPQNHGVRVEQALDAIAGHLGRHLDIAALSRIAGLPL